MVQPGQATLGQPLPVMDPRALSRQWRSGLHRVQGQTSQPTCTCPGRSGRTPFTGHTFAHLLSSPGMSSLLPSASVSARSTPVSPCGPRAHLCTMGLPISPAGPERGTPALPLALPSHQPHPGPPCPSAEQRDSGTISPGLAAGATPRGLGLGYSPRPRGTRGPPLEPLSNIPDSSEGPPGLRVRALDLRACQGASLECIVGEARARVQRS